MYTHLKGRRIFITGHTGFKGSWLAIWLHRLGAQVYGYSLPPPTDPSNYALSRVGDLLAVEWIADIRDRDQMRNAVATFSPEVIFHLAAQPLVRASYREPFETFDVNVMGTASLLDAVRANRKPCAVICITTDKCYENLEREEGYAETDPMGGHDPYSASKGAAEILIASYRRAFFPPDRLSEHGVQLASARAGNVLGGGDFAEDRIITDLVRAILHNRTLDVRNPDAIRPWQHVLEPLSGYLTLAERMLAAPAAHWCEGWNFGPGKESEKTVQELTERFIRAFGQGAWRDARLPGQPHEAGILKLNISKAKSQLGWLPAWTFDTMIERTAAWYHRVLLKGADARTACETDIKAYS